MKRLIVSLWVTLILFSVTAPNAHADPPPDYFIDESKLPFDGLPGYPAEQYWGIHTGAGYRVEVPDNWNGDLFVWNHGVRRGQLELTVDNPPFREWLLQNGYAWAASSFRRNDFDVATGVQDTHALTQYFNRLVSKPDRVYIAGNSMGGQVTAVAIEQYPNTYAGALPLCGPLADYKLFDYYLDYNLVSQALAGQEAQFPPPPDYPIVTVPAVKAALELVPGTFPFTLNAQGTQFAAVVMLQTGGPRPVFNQGFLFWNGAAPPQFVPPNLLFNLLVGDGSVPRSSGIAGDNSDRIYQFDTDPALSSEEQALNDAVLRVSSDPQARKPNGLANVPAVSGNIRVPVLTMHTLGDLFVPFSMEQIYAQRVASYGKSDLLVQRAIRDVAHCTFTSAEYATALEDLVNWVENGVKPAGDPVLDPFAVAAPDFGCAFTNGDRLYPPPLTIPSCPATSATTASVTVQGKDAETTNITYLPTLIR